MTYVPDYVLYLIGFSMILMLLIIVVLSLMLCKYKKYKQRMINEEDRVFGTGNNEPVFRQVHNSTGDYKVDGSTFTVDSVVTDTNRGSGPTTPTRSEIGTFSYSRPALKPIVSQRTPTTVIERRTIEKLCHEVLNRPRKTPSTSMRELAELQNEMNLKEKEAVGYINKPKKQTKENVESVPYEPEIYDTLPTPKNAIDVSNYDMPIYDNIETHKNNIFLEVDSEYLMPIQRSDTISYINARVNRKKP